MLRRPQLLALSPSPDVDRFGLDSLKVASQAGEDNQRLAVERMRMKRFSSALCLADVQQHHEQQQQQQQEEEDQQQQQYQQQVAGLQRKSRPAMDASRPSLQQQQQCKSNAKSAARAKPATDKLQLAPDDPMILARQRRPSVSKGSVNVDQQGECQRQLSCPLRWA